MKKSLIDSPPSFFNQVIQVPKSKFPELEGLFKPLAGGVITAFLFLSVGTMIFLLGISLLIRGNINSETRAVLPFLIFVFPLVAFCLSAVAAGGIITVSRETIEFSYFHGLLNKSYTISEVDSLIINTWNYPNVAVVLANKKRWLFQRKRRWMFGNRNFTRHVWQQSTTKRDS